MGERVLVWMTLLSCAAILVDGSTRANSTDRAARNRRHASCPSCARDYPSALTSPWYKDRAIENNYGSAFGGPAAQWNEQQPQYHQQYQQQQPQLQQQQQQQQQQQSSWYDGLHPSWQFQQLQQLQNSPWRSWDVNSRNLPAPVLEDSAYNRAPFSGEAQGLAPYVVAAPATSALTGSDPLGPLRPTTSTRYVPQNPASSYLLGATLNVPRDPRQATTRDDRDLSTNEDRDALARRNGDRLASLSRDGPTIDLQNNSKWRSPLLGLQTGPATGTLANFRESRTPAILQNPRTSKVDPKLASVDKLASFKKSSDDSSEVSYGTRNSNWFAPVVQDPRSRNYFLRQDEDEGKGMSRSEDDRFVYSADNAFPKSLEEDGGPAGLQESSFLSSPSSSSSMSSLGNNFYSSSGSTGNAGPSGKKSEDDGGIGTGASQIKHSPYGISSDLNVLEMLDRIEEQFPETATETSWSEIEKELSVFPGVRPMESRKDAARARAEETGNLEMPTRKAGQDSDKSKLSEFDAEEYSELERIWSSGQNIPGEQEDSRRVEDWGGPAEQPVTEIPGESIIEKKEGNTRQTPESDSLEDMERPGETTDPTVPMPEEETTTDMP